MVATRPVHLVQREGWESAMLVKQMRREGTANRGQADAVADADAAHVADAEVAVGEACAGDAVAVPPMSSNPRSYDPSTGRG